MESLSGLSAAKRKTLLLSILANGVTVHEAAQTHGINPVQLQAAVDKFSSRIDQWVASTEPGGPGLAADQYPQEQQAIDSSTLLQFSVFDQYSPDRLFIVDSTGRILFQNESSRRYRSKVEGQGDVAGLSDQLRTELVHPDDRDFAMAELGKVFRSGQARQNRLRYLQPDGSYRTCLVTGMPANPNATGLPEFIIFTMVDIEDLVQAELDLDRQKKFFEALVAAAGDLTAVYTRQGNAVYLSERLKRRREAAGLPDDAPFGAFIHPDDLESVRTGFTRWVATGKSGVLQYRYLSEDGRWRVYELHGRPILDEHGQVQYLLAVFFDITDRLEDERRLREAQMEAERFKNNQRLFALISQEVVGLLEADSEGRILSVNQAFCSMLGYTQQQLLAMHRTDLVFPDDKIATLARLDELRRGAQTATNVRRFRHADGSERWLMGKGSLISDQRGGIERIVSFVVDISEQKRVEKAHAESEAKYRLLADHQTDYVQLWAPDGRRLYDSPSLARLYGSHVLTDREFSEQRTTLVHPEDRRLASGIFREIATQGGQRRAELRWLLPSGEVRWVELTANAIYGPDGKIEKILAVSRDISERKLAEQQREQALAQAHAANQAKTQFLAKVSHELRTPLNAVLGYGYLLGQSRLDTTQAEQLAQITGSSRYLLGLISDVLDLSRIEAGQHTLNPHPFDLPTLFERALAVIRPAAEAPGLRLLYDSDPGLPRRLVGDAQLIEQVLLNYLSNAVKFTEQGQVFLHVGRITRAQRSDDEPESVDEAGGMQRDTQPPEPIWLRIEVRDTGPGIAPGKLDQLFKAFSQLEPDKRGSGLGLEITRRLVELMGGEVGVDSALGQGSCFWLTLPLRPERIQEQTGALHQNEPGRSSPHGRQSNERDALVLLRERHAGKTALVADDDQINQGLMSALLSRAGLKVQIVADGVQAVAHAKLASYQVVLMDLQMPHMDGIEATLAIRQLPGWQQVPIISLTANVFTESREACLQAGMSEFLGKPVDPEKLYALMLHLLDESAPHV